MTYHRMVQGDNVGQIPLKRGGVFILQFYTQEVTSYRLITKKNGNVIG